MCLSSIVLANRGQHTLMWNMDVTFSRSSLISPSFQPIYSFHSSPAPGFLTLSKQYKSHGHKNDLVQPITITSANEGKKWNGRMEETIIESLGSSQPSPCWVSCLVLEKSVTLRKSALSIVRITGLNETDIGHVFRMWGNPTSNKRNRLPLTFEYPFHSLGTMHQDKLT